jgi:DNA-binding transcriptional MerR regulator
MHSEGPDSLEPLLEPLYGIEELAERGGVSRRTVRYYVQLGLLDAPTGVGRGRHYTEAHLAQLIRVRELQERGVALNEIGRAAAPASAGPALAEQSTWTRVVLADGVELHLRGRRLDDTRIRALQAAITEVIGEEKS